MSLLTDIRTKIIALVKDDSGKLVIPATTAWAVSTVYSAGARVVPKTANGHIYKCTTAGTSGAVEPVWPTTAGSTVADGTAAWTEEADDYNRHIAAALNIFSKHRPDVKVLDIVGNGTHDYSIPAGWIDEFSSIVSIEYPIGNVPETFLEKDEYGIYQAPTGKKIRMKNNTPSASQSFRVAFMVLRTEATVPQGDEDAFCSLAASLCLEQLANAYAQTSDSTITADAVNYRTKSSEFAARAKRLMAIYKEYIGIKEDDSTPAASAVVDIDIGYPGGSDRLTHPRRRREQR